MAEKKLVLEPFRKALHSLDIALAMSPVEDIVRDGTIQRLEYTNELAWNMLRRHLEWRGDTGVDVLPRKDVYREAARSGLIDDPMRWFKYNEARNATSHDYSRSKADHTYELVKTFARDARFRLEQSEGFHA